MEEDAHLLQIQIITPTMAFFCLFFDRSTSYFLSRDFFCMHNLKTFKNTADIATFTS